MAKGWLSPGNPLADPTKAEYKVVRGRRVLIGYRAKGTGEQIRDYLASRNGDYEMNIWRAIKRECERARVRPPNWESFRNYFNRLKQLQLVLPIENVISVSTADARRGDGTSFGGRRYYRVNPARIGSSDWENPQEAYLRLLARRESETSRR